jgi:hypothetical protein
MRVEFALKQVIDERIDAERRTRRTPHAQAVIQIEASRAVHERLDLRSADLERLFRPANTPDHALRGQASQGTGGQIAFLGMDDLLPCFRTDLCWKIPV